MDDINKSKANNPDYVYMIIPADYACVYARLLVMLSDLGYEMLQDCAAGCKGSNKNIDYAISKIDAVNNFLTQGIDEKFGFDEELNMLNSIFTDYEQALNVK